jgi:chromosome transmission fidelity protein 1
MIPAGMIVFSPSYKFLNFSKESWKKSGLLDKFGSKKQARSVLVFVFVSFFKTTFQVYFEPEDSSAVDKVLQDYAAAATKVSIETKQRVPNDPTMFRSLQKEKKEPFSSPSLAQSFLKD